MRLIPYGESGLLIELESSAGVAAVYRALRADLDRGGLAGVVELVPAARTVLVVAEPVPRDRTEAVPRDRIEAVLRELAGGGAAAGGVPDEERPEVVIPIRYDGADLELVAETASLSVPELVELHSSARYTVAFCGFAPGFGYLTGLPEPLCQARLDSPRQRVPAGSVGVAGEFCGVYPRSSPGGWRLIGRTGQTMFDPAAEPPSRLAPGDRVRFEPAAP